MKKRIRNPKRNTAAMLLFVILKRDYIPKAHFRFDEWQSNFVTEVATLLSTWGISALNADWARVTATATDWNNAWAAANPFIASRSIPFTVGMGTARATYETALRYFIQNYLSKNKKVTPGQRATIGITIHKTSRTYHAVPMDRVPNGMVKHATHLSHQLRLTDPATPDSKVKPEGVKKYIVYMCITEQGVMPSASDFAYVGQTSSYKYISVFDTSQVGKRAHYFVKWMDARQKESNPSGWFNETIH